ncbi:cation-translocating P-type ATPase [Neisseria leonii]|uniref:heavy metal translocating P-type ATPase n=1 Tax=Neisseria leonii TaxID=2995413 RepID=UPI00237B4D5A|nr:heavy metal translocating P-type ATPase [Neisseria sp. 3986]MDD9325800.1 heavy metal translocating P-type ATPase [Neisseria sp. 3986]
MRHTVRFRIRGMTCQACAARIEKVLNKKDFVYRADVSFAAEEAKIEFDAAAADEHTLRDIIRKSGFDAEPAAAPPDHETAAPPLRLWLLLALWLPFLPGMMAMFSGGHQWMLPPFWQWLMASAVQFGFAIPFYRSAWAAVKNGAANMDVLVSIGTVVIYAYSLAAWLGGNGHQLYFETGVMIIGLVSLGKYLEQRAKRVGLNSLGLLLTLTPPEAEVKRSGTWQRLPVGEVQTGDWLRVHSGGRIAADGTVIEGGGWCDESHLTGEPLPAEKNAGSRVLAGALLNDGSLIYRAEQLGSQTLLGDLAAVLAEAQNSKAPVARLADRAAAVFVPAVLLIALATFILTFLLRQDITPAVMNAAAVLVIACPCALGLATPAAVMAGMGKAAAAGVWFKDAPALEAAGRIDTVVLDKTGTLTEGRPQLTGWRCADGIGETELFQTAASLEAHSAHPLARALTAAAAERGIPLLPADQIHTEAGAGISGRVAGWGEVRVGTPAFCGLPLTDCQDDTWARAAIAAVSADGRPLGALALADTLKPDSAAAVGRLKKQGFDIYLMSGDRQTAAAETAAQAGITQVLGGMTPRGKADAVRRLQAQGRRVAMIGDGINDAPALTAADAGFAFYDGSGIAVHSASATLMRPSLHQAADALLIARATLRTIRQNLFFAFIYNIIAIPLAALGWLNPMVAAAAMSLSSLSVIANALRLKHRRIG